MPGTQARVPVSFDYADESDPGPYPVPPDASIEGSPSSTGDRHVLADNGSSWFLSGAPDPGWNDSDLALLRNVPGSAFEAGLSGWTTGNNRTTLVRTCATSHGGSCSAELGRTRTTGDAVLDDSPNSVSSSVAGSAYEARAWVLVPAGPSFTLVVREFNGSKLVRSRTEAGTGAGAWRELVVTSDASNGGTSIGVDVLVWLPTTQRAQVDDLSLRRI